jgi:hypothetical protein
MPLILIENGPPGHLQPLLGALAAQKQSMGRLECTPALGMDMGREHALLTHLTSKCHDNPEGTSGCRHDELFQVCRPETL